MNILFWNLHKLEHSALAAKLLQQKDVDIVFFAEFSELNIETFLEKAPGYRRVNDPGGSRKIVCFAKEEINSVS